MAEKDMTKLMNAMNELIEKGTFSLEAVEGVKQLRDNNKILADKLLVKETEVKDRTTQYNDATAQLSKVKVELAAWEARHKALVEREKKVTELEKKMAVAEAESKIYSNVFATIFRNTIVRENVSSSIPMLQQGGYVSPHPGSETRTTEKE